jgi:hypothetical protein
LVGQTSVVLAPANTTFTTTFRTSALSTSPQGNSLAEFGPIDCDTGRVCTT